MLDETIIKTLVNAGLTEQQAKTRTAELMIQMNTPDVMSVAVKNAEIELAKIRSDVNSARSRLDEIKAQCSEMSKTIRCVADAADKYGEITDEKAKTVVALYGVLLDMGEKLGCDCDRNLESIGYIMYAFLGGQAKCDQRYDGGNKRSDDDDDYNCDGDEWRLIASTDRR